MTPVNETNVVYGSGLTNGGSKTLLMDIYQTGEECTALRPLVLLIHGGGFRQGSKTSSGWNERARDAVARGYVAAAINYRLIPDDPVISAEFDPVRTDLITANVDQDWDNNTVEVFAGGITAAVEDTVAALRYLESNSPADRCIDMSKIGIWGGSAGAITAMHVAYGLDTYSITYPKPAVVIDYWGMVFLDGMIGASEAPLFILHGGNDNLIDPQEARDLKTEADAIGVGASLYMVSGAGHGYSGISIESQGQSVNGKTLLELTLDFLDAHLKDGSPAPVYESVTIN
ncbi:MAG: alpha/beta hydrolase [Alphaproteobacteria bacterium]|nr:alpha/beta hydrolase [Alphaproteobacteria bacterium]